MTTIITEIKYFEFKMLGKGYKPRKDNTLDNAFKWYCVNTTKELDDQLDKYYINMENIKPIAGIETSNSFV